MKVDLKVDRPRQVPTSPLGLSPDLRWLLECSPETVNFEHEKEMVARIDLLQVELLFKFCVGLWANRSSVAEELPPQELLDEVMVQNNL